MSSYYVLAKKPDYQNFEKAIMVDDYWGHHEYGVKFQDGEVYRLEDCEIKDLNSKYCSWL